MSHDPMCAVFAEDDNRLDDWTPLWGVTYCSCEYVAKVRADERKRIEKLIYKNCGHTKRVGSAPCWHDMMVDDINQS